jgi:conjugal transfer pilus assembly protein TraK
LFLLKEHRFKLVLILFLVIIITFCLSNVKAQNESISVSDILKQTPGPVNPEQSQNVSSKPDKDSEQPSPEDIDLKKLTQEVSGKVQKTITNKKSDKKPDQSSSKESSSERVSSKPENVEQPEKIKKDNSPLSDNFKNKLSEIRSQYILDQSQEDVEDIIKKVKNFQSVQIVSAKALTPVRISLRDISRIVCPGKVEGKVFSGEKPIEVKEFNDSLYVKNLPVKQDGEYIYDKGPKDLIVICEGNQVFSLLLIPDDVPSVTIYLQGSGSAKLQEAVKFETENSYIETVLNLIKHIYNNEIPDGYEIEGINKVFREYNEALLIHRLNWIGAIFTGEEYILQAKKDIFTDELFWVQEFENPETIVALSVVDHELKAGNETRIILIRKRF